MSEPKPFHRNFRTIKPAANAGYSKWAYVIDQKYVQNPEHYVRAFALILSELEKIFEYIEPSDEALSVFSYRIHALLMRTCIEIEANFKAIFNENKFTPPQRRHIDMRDFRKIDVTHHLSSYEISLPIWHGKAKIFKPFQPWFLMRGKPSNNVVKLPWYDAYNVSKHDRHEQFKKASFEQLINAVAGLTIVISSQFQSESYSAGTRGLAASGYDYYQDAMRPTTGGLFRIQYPNDWTDDEQYDFNWSHLKIQTDRFSKIDYDAIVV